VAIISNATTIADAGAFSVSLGAMTLIKTLTASSSANLTFVHGSSSVVLDSTYPIYKFEFINIHPSYNGADLKVGFRDGGTDYDATKTTTYFSAYHNEAGNDSGLAYDTGEDLAQSTGFQNICKSIGNANDEVGSGELFLFNPSSTTFVKHFMHQSNGMHSNPAVFTNFSAGYGNTTSAITGAIFKYTSGNMDAGTIKLYGIKDS